MSCACVCVCTQVGVFALQMAAKGYETIALERE